MAEPPSDAPATPHPLAGDERATAALVDIDLDRIYTEVTRREAQSASLRARAAGLDPGMRLDA